MKLATVFSGIGAVEQAIKKLNKELEIIFACDTGERYIDIDVNDINSAIANLPELEKQKYIKKLYENTKKHNHVKDSYFANYHIDEKRWYDDIRFVDGTQFENKVDLFVGGSPCQSFSIIGKRAGLDDARGTLFYEFARLVNEIKPKVFIFENVTGMLTHDKGNTWKVIQEVFDSLGYKIYTDVLNAKDFGIPQDRKRVFVVGFREDVNDFEFPIPFDLTKTSFDFLESKNIETKHYLGKKGFEFVTNPKYRNRARVNSNIIQTQKANQQFNWNGDFVFIPLNKVQNNEDIMARAHVGTWNNQQGVIRQMTYRECLRLMGFPDTFKIVVPNVPAYRQAGNSIVVNVLEEIIKKIMEVVDFDE
ncbi:MAG: DNA cytosine methyltransferase [Peptostreptococcaceae bacterium]